MEQLVKKLSLVIIGLILTSAGIKILSISNLTFGGTAGIASMLNYVSDYSWGVWFFIVNLPFFMISLQKLGKWFTLSSLLSITAISAIRDALDMLALPEMSNMVAGSFLAGTFIGVGVTLVLNNGSSLGGIHILALYLDEQFKVNRGITIFICDVLIIVCAIAMVGWMNGLISIISIVVASSIIGRYKKSPIQKVEEQETVLERTSA